MIKIRISGFVVLLLTLFIISTLSAHAALQNRGTDINGNRLIYDDDLNITWYDYTKTADTWQKQMDWASSLSVNFGGNVYDDWRLPITVDGPYEWGYDGQPGTTTNGYNITSSEMGHLFYAELGNKGYIATDGTTPQGGWGLTNTGYFQTVQVGGIYPGFYWSSTDLAAFPDNAYAFSLSSGEQTDRSKTNGLLSSYYALAVRVGDVPQQPIAPEPISSILFLTGGATLIGRKYIRRKKIEV